MAKKSKTKIIEELLKVDPLLLWRIVRRSPHYAAAVDRFINAAEAAREQLALDLFEATRTNSTLEMFPEPVGPSEPRDLHGYVIPPTPVVSEDLLAEYRIDPEVKYIRDFQSDTRMIFGFPIHPENLSPNFDTLTLCWKFYPAARIFRDLVPLQSLGPLEGMRAEDGNIDVLTIRVDHRFPKALIQHGCQLILQDYLASRKDKRGFLRINARDQQQEGSSLEQKVKCWELWQDGQTKIQIFNMIWPREKNRSDSLKKKRVDSSIKSVEGIYKALWQ